MTQYADFSAARIPGSALKSAGFEGVIRYLGTPGRGKNATRSEIQDDLAAGLFVGGVYENSTTDWATGFAGGASAAHALLADANACGVPPSAPLFVCADMHLTASQTSQFRQYVSGARSVLGSRTGAYGFRESIDAVSDLVTHVWQCGSESALRASANLWQRNDGVRYVNGIACDINELKKPFSAVSQAVVIPPPTGDDEMFFACQGFDPAHPKDILVCIYSGGVLTGLETTSVNNGVQKSFYSDKIVWITAKDMHQLADKSALVAKVTA